MRQTGTDRNRRLGNQPSHQAAPARRTILRIGAMGFWGWTLRDLLRAESVSGIHSSKKSIINIHLDGGPPHLDTIDPKPLAPVEVRGEFSPIETSLPGLHVTELMPKVASIAQKFAFVRSLVGSAGAHDAFQCQSGYAAKDLKSLGGRPAVGSVISRLMGRPDDPTPPFIDLMQGRPLVRNSARPGFLGPAVQPFRPDISRLFHRELESGMKGELARLGQDHSIRLTLDPSLTVGRVESRTSLLTSLDRLRRDVDSSGAMDAMDSFTQQAVGILMSGRLASAMDLDTEDPSVLARYTAADSSFGRQSTTSEGPDSIRKFLLARRLIEAGARCVSVSISDFDTHSDNFPRMRNLMPIVDHGLHALVTDLDERGMLDDVSIVVWGEFGRTPRIDPQTGGRHHWPRVGPALLAGGGMRTGQVIGATDRLGDDVDSRPVHYKDVFATLYANLGIDARQVTLSDPQGRPQYLLDEGTVIAELR
ncbi:MAG: DUF1501 domain-containing protein [Planctomycetaceae bacterium]|nr:DUF1501 domain-containing protein [Planctomycetaceae bacterium]